MGYRFGTLYVRILLKGEALNTLRTGDADLRFSLQLCKTDDANLRF